MYELAGGAAVGATVLGTQFAATQATQPAVAAAAQATLPVTGIAFGLYVAVALTLIIIGFLLRRFGAVEND